MAEAWSSAEEFVFHGVIIGGIASPFVGGAIAALLRRRQPWVHGAVLMSLYLGIAIPALSTWNEEFRLDWLTYGSGLLAVASAVVAANGLRRAREDRPRLFLVAAALAVPMVLGSSYIFFSYVLFAWFPVLALYCEAGRIRAGSES